MQHFVHLFNTLILELFITTTRQPWEIKEIGKQGLLPLIIDSHYESVKEMNESLRIPCSYYSFTLQLCV